MKVDSHPTTHRTYNRVTLTTSIWILLIHINFVLCTPFGLESQKDNNFKQQKELETHGGSARSLEIDFCGNYIELVEPKARDGLDLSLITKAQWAGTKQSSSRFIAEPNTFGFIKFHTKYSCPSTKYRSYNYYASTGFCRIRFSIEFYEDEYSYITLLPESGLHDEEGWFKCGTDSNIFEYVKFKYPEAPWSKCTLQLQHKTEDGVFYQWADVTLAPGLATSWDGLCLNGGSCINGKWYWASGYGGKYCDGAGHFEAEGPSSWFIASVVILVIGLVVFFAYLIYSIINRKTPIKEKISPNNSAIDDIFGGTVFDTRASNLENSTSFERMTRRRDDVFEINE